MRVKLRKTKPSAGLVSRSCVFTLYHIVRGAIMTSTPQSRRKTPQNSFTHRESPSDYNKAAVPAIKSPSQALRALIP